MSLDPVKYAKNRAYQFVEEQQRALDEGTISEAEWFDIYNEFFTQHSSPCHLPRSLELRGRL
jgi:hypothetical protein